MNDITRQARRAGLLYLALALIAPIGLMYVPGEPIVSKIALPLEVAELPIVFWLLIRGARTVPARAA